jgi:hypothetical protein
VGLFVADWIRRPSRATDGWMRLAWAFLAVSGIAIGVGLPLATRRIAPGAEWLGLIGLVPIVGAGLAWGCAALVSGRASLRATYATYLSLVGIGLFSYYQGRSHDEVFALCTFPAYMLLTLFCDYGAVADGIAKALGVNVIGTVGSPEKAALARKYGADHVILYKQENVVERVREITKGAMVPVVYDSVGKDTFAASIDCLQPFGLMVSFGNASGPVPPLPLTALKGTLYITRPSLAPHTEKRENLLEIAGDLMKMVSSGKVSIEIDGHSDGSLRILGQESGTYSRCY